MMRFFSRLFAILALAVGLVWSGVAEAKIKVAFVTSESGMGDRSFNDMMDQGMKRAVKELGIDYVIIQPRSISEFQSTLARAAGQGFDVIIGSSFDMIKPMQAAAAAFPQQKFGLVDVGPDPIAPNVVSSVTKDWEGSFLVGVIAAKVTKTGTIGFVGLMVPHLVRRWTGPRTLDLLPGCVAGGAAFLTACELLSRCLSERFAGRSSGAPGAPLVVVVAPVPLSPWQAEHCSAKIDAP